MSYLKLCQLTNQSETEVYYLEDCDKNVLVNNLFYPLIVSCEVINWESEEEFIKKGKVISFTSAEVNLEAAPENIREEVYQQLLQQYPELIK